MIRTRERAEAGRRVLEGGRRGFSAAAPKDPATAGGTWKESRRVPARPRRDQTHAPAVAPYPTTWRPRPACTPIGWALATMGAGPTPIDQSGRSMALVPVLAFATAPQDPLGPIRLSLPKTFPRLRKTSYSLGIEGCTSDLGSIEKARMSRRGEVKSAKASWQSPAFAGTRLREAG